jgi:hypothetical protein
MICSVIILCDVIMTTINTLCHLVCVTVLIVIMTKLAAIFIWLYIITVDSYIVYNEQHYSHSYGDLIFNFLPDMLVVN